MRGFIQYIMKKITELKQFTEMAKNYRRAETNFFMLPAQISALCDQGALYASENTGIFKILCKRDDYFNFYYYAAENAEFDFSDVLTTADDKEILLDTVSSNDSESNFIAGMLSENIIDRYKVYQRMTLDIYNNHCAVDSVLCEGYSENGQFNPCEIIKLWRCALDEKSTPLPNAEQLTEINHNKRLITVYNGNRLSGTGMLEIAGKRAVLQHLSVSPIDRRKGLADYIVTRIIRLASDNNIRILNLWVDKNNLPAVNLYVQKGFVPDGIISKQYIFKKGVTQ